MDGDEAAQADIEAALEQRDLLEAMANSRLHVKGPGDDRSDEQGGASSPGYRSPPVTRATFNSDLNDLIF